MDSAITDAITWCREHKLRAIGSVWGAGMGASLAYNYTKPNLAVSVKVIHSRIYAQALTLGCLMASGAAEYYDREYGAGKGKGAQKEAVDPYAYKAPQHIKMR